jgi:hypothetical protein
VPCRPFFDFLPPNWTCAFQRIQLSSIAFSPGIRGFYVHQRDMLSSHRMPVLFVGEKNGGMRTAAHASIMLPGTTTRLVLSGNGASAGEAGRGENTVGQQGKRTGAHMHVFFVLRPSFVSPKNVLDIPMTRSTEDQIFAFPGCHEETLRGLSRLVDVSRSLSPLMWWAGAVVSCGDQPSPALQR